MSKPESTIIVGDLGNCLLLVAPDLLRRLAAISDEDPERVAGHMDQLAAHVAAPFPEYFADDHKAPLCLPAE